MTFVLCIKGRVAFLEVETGKYKESWGWRGREFIGNRACKGKKECVDYHFFKLTERLSIFGGN